MPVGPMKTRSCLWARHYHFVTASIGSPAATRMRVRSWEVWQLGMAGVLRDGSNCRSASLEIDFPSARCEFNDPVIGGFSGQHRKVDRQIARRLRIQVRSRPPHVLLRKWIVPHVVVKIQKLVLDVLVPLPCEFRRRGVAVSRRAMAPRAIAYTRRDQIAGRRGARARHHRQDRQYRTDESHLPRYLR